MPSSIIGFATKREGSAKIRSSKGTPVYECQYSFIVRCTAKDEPYLSVLSTPGLPIVGITPDPTGFGVCTGKSGTRRSENPLIWDIICDFSSEIEDTSGSSGQPTSDPVTWIPVYETRYERIEEPSLKDVNDDAIRNSAGETFPAGIVLTRKIPVWSFFQIESATVTDKQILDRTDVVNASAVSKNGFSYPAKTLLCNVVSSVIGRYYGQLRRLTQYEVRYKSTKWTLKRADVGYRFKRQGSDDLIVSPSAVLVSLDGEGRPAGGYDTPTTPTKRPEPPKILEFDIYKPVSFSFLR